MIAGLTGIGYRMLAPLRDVLRADPTRDDWAGFTSAMAFADAGYQVLPVVPGGKAPIPWGSFQHGARSATSDREAVRDSFINNPGANVGIAIDPGYIVIDIDPRSGGALEAAERLGLPVDGYRERSGGGGWHLPLTLPSGARVERSAILAPGVEVKSAGSYVISPHSRLDGAGWYRPEPDRDVWFWPMIPASWPYLDRLKRQETARIVTAGATEQERRLAGKVLHDLANGKYAHNVRLLIAGEWSKVRNDDGTARYGSQSHADLSLMAMAVYGAAGNPRVLDCVMRMTKLFRPKWDAIHDGDGSSYGQMTIAVALSSSPWVSRAKVSPHTDIDSIPALIRAGQTLLAGAEMGTAKSPVPTTVFMLRHSLMPTEKNRVISGISAFLLGVQDAGPDSLFARGKNWVRVPVSDLSESLDCDRKTITRALEKLASAGLIERDVTVVRVNGQPRRDSLVRLVAGMDAML